MKDTYQAMFEVSSIISFSDCIFSCKLAWLGNHRTPNPDARREQPAHQNSMEKGSFGKCIYMRLWPTPGLPAEEILEIRFLVPTMRLAEGFV